MTLTQRATKYFKRLERNSELYFDRVTTIEYCNRLNFPFTEKLIEIQTIFSGYRLTITNDSGHSFLMRLFSKSDVKNNNKIEAYYFDKFYVVDFGQHATAQYNFYVTNTGELCTLGILDDDIPNIICSSIEKFVEQYALKDELTFQTKNPYYYHVLKYAELIKLLEQDFSKIEECSDKYSQWFTNKAITIEIGTYLERPEFYVHVYGQKKENCDEFIGILKQYKIIA